MSVQRFVAHTCDKCGAGGEHVAVSEAGLNHPGYAKPEGWQSVVLTDRNELMRPMYLCPECWRTWLAFFGEPGTLAPGN